MPRWNDTDVPDQTGRTVAVTGATGGLGLRVAEVLASHGARVLVGSRNPDRGAAALARIAAAAGAAPPEVVDLDLASLRSVESAAADILCRSDGRLDLLINNGGIMAPPLAYSVDGFESQWATNVLGATALTWRLLPAIEAAPAGRVVFVSSTRHLSASLDEAQVRADVRGDNYRGFDYYGRTKLADLLMSRELDEHFRRVGSHATALAAHPGFTATGIVSSGFAALPRAIRPIARWGMRALGQSVEVGALPILYAATAPGAVGDGYYGPRALGGLRGYPGPARRSPESLSDSTGESLVTVVADLVGLSAPR
jgi:NAD(P)-dependent dehydrogenase (short-subunit alcohol dehydrogenase family)